MKRTLIIERHFGFQTIAYSPYEDLGYYIVKDREYGSWVVDHDPDEAPLSPGCFLPAEHVVAMLDQGTFTPGTVLRKNKRNDLRAVVVRNRSTGKQRLMLILESAPDPQKKPEGVSL